MAEKLLLEPVPYKQPGNPPGMETAARGHILYEQHQHKTWFSAQTVTAVGFLFEQQCPTS
jgi:hypothetical protein